MNKKELKEYCINMFINGISLSKIAEDTNKSRTFITNLIKEDERYKMYKQNRKIKVYKRKHYKQMTIHIPTDFIKGIGITDDKSKNEFVNVFFDKNNNQIIISKV